MLSLTSLSNLSLGTAAAGAAVGVGSAVSMALVYLFVVAPARSPLKVMPGPPSTHWFFGNLQEIFDVMWDQGKFPEPILSWMLQYGGVFRYRAMIWNRILLTDPVAIKHVVVTNSEIYPRDNGTRTIFRDLIGGDGLLSTESVTHAQQRKMLQPLFRHDNIKSFLGIFQRHVRRLQHDHLRHIEATTASPDRSVNLHELFTKLTMDIIGVSAFSYDFNALRPADHGASTRSAEVSVMEALELLLTPPSLMYIVGMFLLPFFPSWPLPPQNQRRRARRKLFHVVDAVLEAKLSSSTKTLTAAPAPSKKMLDLVDLMLAESNDHNVSIDEARMHVMTFMLAGHETTSTMLSWVFAVLAQHPDVEAKARAESRRVLAANDDTWDWKALGELKYTTAVIHEVLRLFPTASQLATRLCIQDNDMPTSDGKTYFVPKGATVLVHSATLHRNPKYWSQPNEFRPDRFVEGAALFEADKALRGGQGTTYFYMPFSTGPKNCIGMRFAMAELQVVVATLLTRHSFRLASDADVLPTMLGVTMRPRNLKVTVHVVE